MDIGIGGVGVRFLVGDGRMASRMRRRYGGYGVGSGMPLLELSCRFTAAARGASESCPVVRRCGAGDLHLSRPDFSCSLVKGSGFCRIHRSIYSFDALLRTLFATLLSERNRMLLHAAAVVVGRRKAVVIAGVSGAGKTTAARNMGHRGILNDEICAVGYDDTGALRVWGTPFWGEMRTGPSLPAPYGVEAVCFPERGDTARAMPAQRDTALGRLLRCACSFSEDRRDCSALLETCVRVVGSVPLYRLALPDRPLDWRHVEREPSR